MPFQWRVFALAKEPEHPEQNQDSWWVDPQGGVAAIADGVTSGIFSAQWAQILARAAVAEWPDPDDGAGFAAWLAQQRHKWHEEIDISGLAWYQKAKLREGGFTTLVWLRTIEPESQDDSGLREVGIEAIAIGDSCLFHIRGDELIESFPIDASLQFDSSPMVIGSVDLHRDGQLQFQRFQTRCRDGDLLVLCTDAVAAWALDRQERGQPVSWDDYWEMAPGDWENEVRSLRAQDRMRYDDATLLLLKVAPIAGEAPGEVGTEDPTPALEAQEDLCAPDSMEPPVSRNALPPAREGETYDLAEMPEGETPRQQVFGADTQVGGPPPPPPPVQPSGPPSPPPGTLREQPEPDWRDKVSDFSERWFKKLSEQLSRGADVLQEKKESAVRKYREKTGDAEDDDEPTRS